MSKPKHNIAELADEAQARKRILAAMTPGELIQDQKLSLKGSMRASVIKRLSQMPIGSRMTYIKALKGSSREAAVKSFCMECVCWLRAEVAQCTDPGCPLYPYRPFKGMLEDED